MKTELKPCPFCGGEAEVIREGTPRVSCQVSCTNCSTHVESNEQGYGRAWNTRSPALTTEDVERICKAIYDNADWSTKPIVDEIRTILTETLTPKDSPQTERVDRAVLEELVGAFNEYLLAGHKDARRHASIRAKEALKQAEIALGVK